ncbi:AAA family ATPase [Pseudomonas zhanjiangensis]|uniref:AAA family ATPase n=1 Tax=Pseudomonas zhanjiangensis TaxID=3239015 RepID=A0ABV3YQ20_9PSED
MTSLHADEAFLDHYGFSHDPFAARVPGFKFFAAQRKPVLGQLHHLARYSQLLLVVTGPLGSGKTLLRQALVASTNKQAVQSVIFSARGAAEPDAVLRQIAQGLQMQQAESAAILAQVGQLALTGQEVYLLVDDAEQLSDAALDVLLRLAAGSVDGRPHVFLFAEPQLLSRLERLADGEECFHAIDLQPYGDEETQEYLAQRLEGAGRGLEVFTGAQLATIHEQSQGWPGAINRLARDVLVEAMLAQQGAARRAGLTFSLPKKHLLALLVVGVGVVAAWLMQGLPSGDPLPSSAPLPLAQVEQSASVAVAPDVSVEEGTPPIEFAGASQPLPLPLVGEAQPVIREPVTNALGMSAERAEEPAAPVGQAVAATQPKQVDALPVAAPVVPPAPVAPVTPEVAPAVKPAPAQPVAPAKPASAADWYSAQPASRFTLQILGSRAEASAQAFVRQHGADYHYFKKRHKGQPLYVVTYGSFATREAAQAALRQLPAKVLAGQPWPRAFAGIQQEIAQAR